MGGDCTFFWALFLSWRYWLWSSKLQFIGQSNLWDRATSTRSSFPVRYFLALKLSKKWDNLKRLGPMNLRESRSAPTKISKSVFRFQIVFIVMTPITLLALVGKALYYPLKDIIGGELCQAETYLHLWYNMHCNFLTFVVTLFRYICLFHEDKIIRFNLSPKVRIIFQKGLRIELRNICI